MKKEYFFLLIKRCSVFFAILNAFLCLTEKVKKDINGSTIWGE
jgi:hypothetical protein